MLNLEERMTHVWHPEARTLVTEAYRCYSTGTPRAAIMLTWTAVCADLTHKLYQLAEDGEGKAGTVVQQINGALGKNDADAVRAMQQVESGLLQTAVDLELIDFTEQQQLERLRQDRNLCAHPSLRPLGDLFTPSLDYARTHLATALDTLLVHPPSQGRRVVDRFGQHAADPAFAITKPFITQTYFDRVRPAARQRIVELAAKHAVLTLDVSGEVPANVVADNMAVCLEAFAERDRSLVRQATAKAVGRLADRSADHQLGALRRLGHHDFFTDSLDAAMWQRFDVLIRRYTAPLPHEVEASDLLAVEHMDLLALVGIDVLRKFIPSLQSHWDALPSAAKAGVIIYCPERRYLLSCLPTLIRDAADSDGDEWTRASGLFTRFVMQKIGPFLDEALLGGVLAAWAESELFRVIAGPESLSALYQTVTPTLQKSSLWHEFSKRVEELDGSSSGTTAGYQGIVRNGTHLPLWFKPPAAHRSQTATP